MQVTVSVLDRNDSPPSFRGSPLSFLVSEELAVGQAVATLAATDPDTIGELSYTLVEAGATTAASPFTLDARTGVIRLRDALDRELQDSYRLLVRASDGVQSTDAFVTIQVRVSDGPRGGGGGGVWPVVDHRGGGEVGGGGAERGAGGFGETETPSREHGSCTYTAVLTCAKAGLAICTSPLNLCDVGGGRGETEGRGGGRRH
ncbi:hypothetical protein ONE63_004680 [Megalurothrips usitatus]|uniref:Cadherin domain-containing protein n=1 Tax=Megalurothrips usitatus TaxID=439358 RepID=A0AAV7X0G3_9NEOP|nr:hypothetical protein ONE63_004680 [Megalurothrips usitatus]